MYSRVCVFLFGRKAQSRLVVRRILREYFLRASFAIQLQFSRGENRDGGNRGVFGKFPESVEERAIRSEQKTGRAASDRAHMPKGPSTFVETRRCSQRATIKTRGHVIRCYSKVRCDTRYKWATGNVLALILFSLCVKIIGIAIDKCYWLTMFTFATRSLPGISVSLHYSGEALVYLKVQLARLKASARWVDFKRIGEPIRNAGLRKIDPDYRETRESEGSTDGKRIIDPRSAMTAH